MYVMHTVVFICRGQVRKAGVLPTTPDIRSLTGKGVCKFGYTGCPLSSWDVYLLCSALRLQMYGLFPGFTCMVCIHLCRLGLPESHPHPSYMANIVLIYELKCFLLDVLQCIQVNIFEFFLGDVVNFKQFFSRSDCIPLTLKSIVLNFLQMFLLCETILN